MELPNDPIEPWLLKKENGPFMVLAKTFRGPDCERMALALAKELRGKYGLPAYILRSKDFPGKSNIRQVPPTAEPGVVQANIRVPEKYRTYDEAAVLVGNEKTEKDSALLLHEVKKIKPDCLNAMPSMFKWREGLSTALRTTNPYVPAQYLYPRKSDRLVVQMNQTSRSIANCPGRFSLQVAEFSGRSTFNDKDERFQGLLNLNRALWRRPARMQSASPTGWPRIPTSRSWDSRSTSFTTGPPAGSTSARSTPGKILPPWQSARPC